MRPTTFLPSHRPWRRGLGYGALLASLAAGVAACSFLLDRNTVECQVDSDCVKFGVQPSCVSGACVDTGKPCFAGVPDGEATLLTACVPATCIPFDDCARLDVCGDAGLPPLTPPPGPTTQAGPGDAGMTLPLCSELAGGFVPVITGSSNFPTLLNTVAPLISMGALQLAPGPQFIWQTTSSCAAASAVWATDANTRLIHDPPPGANITQYAQFYDKTGTATPCLLGEAGMPVTVAESDVYSTTCSASFTTTEDISDRAGPIQAMAFVVPSASSQTAISHDAAYLVFGVGGASAPNIPWNNPARLYIRSKTTGTQQMIGKEIGVPPDQFWGIDQHTAANVEANLAGLMGMEAEQAIGLLSVSVYDANRGDLKALAYRRSTQDCAYLPDSTAQTTDKANVRSGHYPIWGPLHFFTSATETNQEVTAIGSSPSLTFVNFFAGNAVNPTVLDKFISSGLVPACAMSVVRNVNAELGEMQPFTPKNACSCYFDSQTQQTLPSECRRCGSDADCPAARPACNYGYCEIQ